MGKSISLGNLQRYDEKIKGHIEKKLNQEHSNKSVLEKLSEDENGNLLYNGEKLEGERGLNEMVLSSREW